MVALTPVRNMLSVAPADDDMDGTDLHAFDAGSGTLWTALRTAVIVASLAFAVTAVVSSRRAAKL